MRNPRLTLLSIIAVIVTTLGSSIRAETPVEKALREDLNRAYSQIDQLGEKKDIQGLMRMADDVARDWKSRDMKSYGELTVRIGEVLRSECADKRIPAEEIKENAMRALKTYDLNNPNNISIESHYCLVAALQERPTYQKGAMSDKEWAAKRKTEAERWMVVWDRMEAAFDPKWDPDAPLTAKVLPPSETNFAIGASPDAIKDPALKAQYKRAIEENNLKLKHDYEQRQLVKLKKRFTRSLTLYFGKTYSVAPYNDVEIETLLLKHVKDAGIRSAILKSVNENKSKAPPKKWIANERTIRNNI